MEVANCPAGPPLPFAEGMCTVPDESDLVRLPTGLGEEGPALCAWLREALREERNAVARDLLSKHTAMITELESRMCGAAPQPIVPKAPPPQKLPRISGESREAPSRVQSRVQFEAGQATTISLQEEDCGPPGCVNLRGAGEAGEDVARRSGWEEGEEAQAGHTKGTSTVCKSKSRRTDAVSEHAKRSELAPDMDADISGTALMERSGSGGPSMARAANRLFKSTKSQRSGAGSKRQQKLRRIVKSNSFEIFSSMIIALTTMIAALQVQYHSFGLGHDLGYRWYPASSEDTWPGGATFFQVMDIVCGVLFTIEVVVKVIALRSDFCYDRWNFLDLSVTICWYVEVLGKSYSSAAGIDPALLRLGRLVRLFRLLKLAKKIEGFDSLYLMTTAVRGSASSLAWSCLLLFLFQLTVALLVHSLLDPWYLRDESKPTDERQEVFAYWGSFSRAILTTFEMTLADFPEPCRMLTEYVTEWFMVFFIAHKLTIGFAVIGVINGVFIQETFKVATTDDQLMIRQRERMVKTHAQKMERLFDAADGSGDGLVDVEEFQATLREPDVQTWLASMDLDVEDAGVVFQLVDADGDGRLTAEELVAGVSRLMGDARNLDLLVLMREQREVMQLIQSEVIPKLGLILGTSVTAKRSAVSQLGQTRLAGIGGRLLRSRAGSSTRVGSSMALQ